MSRVKTLKIHDSQIFLPHIPFTIKSGTVNAGEENGATIEMTMNSDRSVTIYIKKGGAKGEVLVPQGGYAYAVMSLDTPKVAEPKK